MRTYRSTDPSDNPMWTGCTCEEGRRYGEIG